MKGVNVCMSIICFCHTHSGSNDTIFIYMADHGTPGLFGFPKSSVSFVENISE